MTDTIPLAKAETNLASLVEEAAQGRETLIARDAVAIARLSPISTKTPRKPSGLWTITRMDEDFDAPDAEVYRLFEGEG